MANEYPKIMHIDDTPRAIECIECGEMYYADDSDALENLQFCSKACADSSGWED